MLDFSIILAVSSMLLIAISDLIYKIYQSTGKSEVGTFMVIQGTVFMITVYVVAIIEGITIVFDAILIAMGCGLLVFTALTLFMISLKKGEAVANVSTFRLNFVYVAVFSVTLLGEELTLYRIIGLGFAVAAVLVFSRAGERKQDTGKSLLIAFIASVIFAVANFLYKVGLIIGASAASFLSVQSTIYLISSLIYKLATEGKKMVFSRRTVKMSITCGILQAAAFLAMLAALQKGDAIVIIPITQVSFLLTALLVVIFMHEKANILKTLALTMAICAIVFLSL